MQPSEIDRLTTYEFNKYVELLDKQVKSDKEYDLTVAQRYGIGNLISSKR